MIRLVKHAPQTARRVRDELAAAREHLRAAAEEGSYRAARDSRRARRTAEHRARDAARALRRYRPRTPWRWLGVGLGVGVAAGAIGAAIVRRRRAADSEPVQAAPVVAALRERGAAVADRAVHAARSTVARARRVAGRDPAGDEAGDAAGGTSQAMGQAPESTRMEPTDRPDGARPALDPDPDATSQ